MFPKVGKNQKETDENECQAELKTINLEILQLRQALPFSRLCKNATEISS